MCASTENTTQLSPQHRFEEHVGEIALVIEADTLPGLFSEAGVALAELLTEGTTPPANGPEHVVAVSGRDAAAVLCAWLNELIYLSETTKRVYNELRIEDCSAHAVRARVRGYEVERVRTAIKAASMHGLTIDSIPGGYRAKLVLDV